MINNKKKKDFEEKPDFHLMATGICHSHYYGIFKNGNPCRLCGSFVQKRGKKGLTIKEYLIKESR